MKKLFLYITLLLSLTSFSQNLRLNSFIPKGWKTIAAIEGDLNSDSLEDVVIVIEEIDLKESKLKPRQLLILFKNKNNELYSLKAQNDVFIPTVDYKNEPCLEDPFNKDKVSIKNGILSINLRYFYNCGSWNIVDETYKFRFQEDNFVLIGYDAFDYHRVSGDMKSVSVNLLTQKKKITVGQNIFKDNNAITKWSDIDVDKSIMLKNIGTANYSYFKKWI
ncbi:hypothetical protein [Flavobacterium litorale]|uniref:VCBS repeat-containing protein n=1 Tax=Flavobacterium litorale TaxID=2856519 RepID=A0ABX8V8M8_9FLAO|nr:hypothetical protein [Flavobacterium litorale]QYJ69199.1 hypothetical protein K1I41_04720 [Flavobacterium litorale]